jgi:hypothetical protein
MPYDADDVAGLSGFNLVTKKVVSDVEGLYQFGFQKNVNLILDVHDALGRPIDLLQLVLTYTPPGGSLQTELIILDKTILIERLLPTDVPITATVTGNTRFADATTTITVPSGTQRVLSLLVPFRNAYALYYRRRFL